MEENKGATEVVERKRGYYWVKEISSSAHEGRWIIAQFISIGWQIMTHSCLLSDFDFEEIDERQICRS